MKTEAHIRYRNKEGKIVPGVTTIVNQLAKPALIIWANRLGLQGIDSTKFRDEAAEIGSLAHYLILSYLKGEKPDVSDYTPNQLDLAENCVLFYWDWEKNHKLESILIETPLVSEDFGGTPDWYGRVDGELTLIDYKSGGIYEEGFYQVCAYRQLLIENGYERPDRIVILGIPRSPDEAFAERVYTSFQAGWEIFQHLKAVYELRKKKKQE
jgi:hypothetical protein